MFESFIVPSIRLNIVTTTNLGQDNCRVHTARHLQESYKASNVKVIDWPSRSPYLNIVENIWKVINDLVYGGIQPKSFNEIQVKINAAADIVHDEKRLVI